MSTEDCGAYRLVIELPEAALLTIGRLGRHRFAAGTYVYLGSARRALAARLSRHRRLAEQKAGKHHWHVDQLLLWPASRLREAQAVPGGDECALARATAAAPGVSVPLPGFGASDCRNGCPAHLFRIA